MANQLFIEQGTEEWLDMRRTRIGASDAPIILGVSPYKNEWELFYDKMEGIYSPPTPAMLRGIENESAAREMLENQFGFTFSPAVFEHSEHRWMIASLDAISHDHTIGCEIKCNGKKNHALAKEGIVPDVYQVQMQQQMLVMDWDFIYYFSYCIEDPSDSHILSVTKDVDIQHTILEKCKIFHDRLMNFDPPPPPYQEITDSMWNFLRSELTNIRHEKKVLEVKEQNIIRRIREYAQDQPSKGLGMTLYKQCRKGSVEYSKIPELKDVDLDKYRKKPSEFWQIKIAE